MDAAREKILHLWACKCVKQDGVLHLTTARLVHMPSADGVPAVVVPLEHGGAYAMCGPDFQAKCTHEVPQAFGVLGCRISITGRRYHSKRSLTGGGGSGGGS